MKTNTNTTMVTINNNAANAAIAALYDTEKKIEASWNAFPWTQLWGWKAVAAAAAVGLEGLQAAMAWTRISPRSRGVVVMGEGGRRFRVTYRPDCYGVGMGLAELQE